MEKILSTIMVALAAWSVQAQSNNQLAIPLTSPNERGMLEVSQINGDIIIEGYDGKEVIVNWEIGTGKNKMKGGGDDARAVLAEVHEKEKYKDKYGSKPDVSGMKRIESNPVEIQAEEEDNFVEISTESWKRRVDLTIKVPKDFDLSVGTIHGVVEISNVSGEMEVSNVNGPIRMESVEGSVLANTVNGELVVQLKSVIAGKEMSFANLNGAVDVTFPANVKATAKMKTDRGDIYTDFDMTTENIREEERDDNGQYSVSINSLTRGLINGGGPTFTFRNMNGDIIIRKGN
ncbi:MAG: hypothetical protein JXQ90_17280 [Cyclobacteriaceae bacterium]